MIDPASLSAPDDERRDGPRVPEVAPPRASWEGFRRGQGTPHGRGDLPGSQGERVSRRHKHQRATARAIATLVRSMSIIRTSLTACPAGTPEQAQASMDETCVHRQVSAGRSPRDPSTGMTWFAWTAPSSRETNGILRLLECGGRRPRLHRWLRLPTGCSPRTCRACREDPVASIWSVFSRTGSVLVSITVPWRGASCPRAVGGLSGPGGSLNPGLHPIALPAHNQYVWSR